MEKSIYYPLRVGKYSSCIVSDMPSVLRNKKDMDNEYEHYGGFLIAESIPSEVAKALVDAYNEKYGCPAGIEMKPCTGGQMCCQSKISHHEWVEQENRLKSNFRLPYEEIDPFESMSKNSAHSFTEGAEVPKTNRADDIDWQIEFLNSQINKSIESFSRSTLLAIRESLRSIKRWNESPAYHGKVDVEKVIEDLKELAEELNTEIAIREHPAIVNAEAALGMLQAFKQEREGPADWVKKYVSVATKPWKITP